MHRITKEFHFSAGHHLDGLPSDHPCARRHGHNYLVKIELSDTILDEHGFVKDYNDLKPIKDFIDNALDHKYLNDFLPFNPTAENISKHLFETFQSQFPQITAIEVSETPKTNCRYEP